MIRRPSRIVAIGLVLALAFSWVPVAALADEASLQGPGSGYEVVQPTGVLQDVFEVLLLVLTLVRSAMRYWANGHRG